ncbi:AsmA family protein [Zhongshania sp. BJYM1]|uniref:AsmA family protein n=1 Tax=Zhongshania aquatica TaxID=2965069 RepID=UPI0022B2CAE1|nr:AsmA-like C-terminal region-containing protein [Marortus sp. BJYM1]
MIKKILLGLSLLILLVLVTLSISVIQPHLLRGLIGSGAQRFAGLDVDIIDIQSHMNPLRFEISGLQVSNPEWPRPELLSLGDITIALIQSPFGDKPFWQLSAKKLSINVEQNEDGELNWISGKLKTDPNNDVPDEISDGPLLPGDFNFDHIEIKEVALQWRNKKGEETRIFLPEVRAERIEAGNGDFYIGLDYLEQHVELSSAITLFDPQKGILGYDLSFHHEDLDIKSKGQLVLSPNLDGSTLSVDIDLRSADALAKLANTDIPKLPITKLSAKIAITPNYELSDIVLQLNDSKIQGDLNINAESSAVNGNLRSAAVDIDSLLPPSSEASESAPSNTPPAVTVDNKEAEMDWAWLDDTDVQLKLTVDELSAQGWQLSGIKSTIAIKKAIALKLSATQISELATKRDIKDFTADLSLTPLAVKTTGSDVKVSLKTTQHGITAETTGKVNLNGVAGTELQLNAQAESSQAIWTVAQLPWQEAGAFSIDAAIKTTANSYSIKGNSALGEQSTDVDLHFNPAASATEIASLKGSISLRKIDLAFLNPVASDEKPVEDKPTPKSSKQKLISNDPIALDVLKTVNAELQIQLEDIDTGYNLIRKAKLKPTLKNGLLKLKDTTINFDGGEAKIALKLDTSQTTPTLDLRFSVDAEDYGKLGLNKAAGIDNGAGRIRLDADSKGGTPHQLASNMNANLDMKITNLVAQGNALNLIGSDVLSETIDKLNPFSEKKTRTDIECIAVHFKGTNGKFFSDDGIALETEQTKIIGTGNIDIGKEELLLGVSPIARTGVGINVGAAAGLVRLGGTFSKPKIVADPSGMFTSGLSTGAAIYTGGLSLLAQGLIKRAIYSGSACDGDIDEIPTVEELPDEILNPVAPPIDGAEPATTAAIQ